MNFVEVCFTPILYNERTIKDNFAVVVVDILRATTSICAAFANDVLSIIPVTSIEEAKAYKEQGYLIASERGGKKLDFADFGNSAFSFMNEEVKGKTIVYSTTNGTEAIEIAKDSDVLVIGAFSNFDSLSQWLINQNLNVVILCSGWKNKFNLEDSIFAGALTEKLINNSFTTECDSAKAAIDLWSIAKENLLGYIEKAAHRDRLRKLNLDDVLDFSFKFNTANVVPVLKEGKLIDILKY
jgi:2-phosphosulfolactate phosphatase